MQIPIFLVIAGIGFLVLTEGYLITDEQNIFTYIPNTVGSAVCVQDNSTLCQVKRLYREKTKPLVDLSNAWRSVIDKRSPTTEAIEQLAPTLKKYCEEGYPSWKNDSNELIQAMKSFMEIDKEDYEFHKTIYAYQLSTWTLDYACKNQDTVLDSVQKGGVECFYKNYDRYQQCVTSVYEQYKNEPSNSVRKFDWCEMYGNQKGIFECFQGVLNTCKEPAAGEWIGSIAKQLPTMKSCNETIINSQFISQL